MVLPPLTSVCHAGEDFGVTPPCHENDDSCGRRRGQVLTARPPGNSMGVMGYRNRIAMAAGIVVAVVLLAAGVGKLLGESAFLLELSHVFISAAVSDFIASVLPWVEIVLGLCLLVGIAPQVIGGLSSLLVAAFIFHNSWLIAHGWGYHPCGCLGVLSRITGGDMSTTSALYVDIGLFALALTVYFLASGPVLDLRPWFRKRPPVQGSPVAEPAPVPADPDRRAP